MGVSQVFVTIPTYNERENILPLLQEIRRLPGEIEVDSLVSQGPSIVHEILCKAHWRGFSIQEVPIHFEDRRTGRSNLNLKKLLFSAWMVLKLRKLAARPPAGPRPDLEEGEGRTRSSGWPLGSF